MAENLSDRLENQRSRNYFWKIIAGISAVSVAAAAAGAIYFEGFRRGYNASSATSDNALIKVLTEHVQLFKKYEKLQEENIELLEENKRFKENLVERLEGN